MRVLVVEDELKMGRALQRGLAKVGYAVDLARDGDGALFQVTLNEYDAIVLDLMLPDRDGVDVCGELRARGTWAPVLMLTARGTVADRIGGLDAGADDYLVKPFAFQELLARLRALIRRGARPRPPVLALAGLELDPARHLVRNRGTAVDLSPREFALLEYLMRRPGEVVTRSELLDHLWDENYQGMSNVVDVYVSYVRKKLSRAGSGPRIQTVRGVGYRMVGE
ncbi:two-component system response regulator TcrA [soil metagenome]